MYIGSRDSLTSVSGELRLSLQTTQVSFLLVERKRLALDARSLLLHFLSQLADVTRQLGTLFALVPTCICTFEKM